MVYVKDFRLKYTMSYNGLDSWVDIFLKLFSPLRNDMQKATN